jgi:hypothetical protein
MSLISHCIAVHATDILPLGGVIVPGAILSVRNKEGKYEEKCRAVFRQTLHWSLNQVALNHRGGSWSEKKMAILTPLTYLKEQLVNVGSLDTYVQGEVTMDEHFTVVIREGEDTSALPERVRVVRFNPENGSLAESVAREVQVLGGSTFTAKEALPDTASLILCQMCDKKVDADHFTNLIEANPKISYGDHMHSERGQAWRFGAVEGILEHFTKVYLLAPLLHFTLDRPSKYRWDDWEILGNILDHHLERLTNEFGETLSLQLLQQEAKKCRQMIIAEKWLQAEAFLGTLQSPSSEATVEWIKNQVMDQDLKSFSVDKKNAFIDESKRYLTRLHYSQTDKLEDKLGSFLKGATRSEIESFSSEPKVLFEVLLAQWYRRGDRTEFDQAASDGKFHFFPNMFLKLKYYNEQSKRLDPKYAERAKEICAWIAETIQNNIDQYGFEGLLYSFMIDEYMIENYRKIYEQFQH